MAPELRHRTNRIEELPDDYEEPQETKKAAPPAKGGFPFLDILRSLFGLFLVAIVASYFITGTAYWTAAIPQFMRPQYIMAQLRGPLELTIDELAQFDGRNPDKPLYIGLDGVIYDVSKGRMHYGPGGGYSFFGGKDGTRAFVTGCFQTDVTGDLRGAEEMFMPIEDDPEGDSSLSSGEIKQRRERERREAKRKVQGSIDHWVKFFSNSPKYFKVGTIKREPGWLDGEPKRELCDQAVEQRPKRSTLREQAKHM